MDSKLKYSNSVVVVTGGSKGIGLGICKQFAVAGANVVMVARDEKQLEQSKELLQNLKSQQSIQEGSIYTIKGDVGVVSDCQSVIDQTIQKFGKIDILVANAGVFPAKTVEEAQEKDFDEIFNINVKGTFFIMKAALPHMKQKGYGRIVFTSSITGPVTGYPGWSLYGATKAAQLGIMRSSALEVAKHGITINSVLPGNIATVNTPEAIQYFQKMERSIPVGSIGQPEDIGHAVLYLASPEARFVTGQTLVVDGGQILPEESSYLWQ